MKNKGFTLVELLVVIVILGLLIALAMPSILDMRENSAKNTLAYEIMNYTTKVKSKYVGEKIVSGVNTPTTYLVSNFKEGSNVKGCMKINPITSNISEIAIYDKEFYYVGLYEPLVKDKGKAIRKLDIENLEETINQINEFCSEVIIPILPSGTLAKKQNEFSEELFWGFKENITQVTFNNTINIPSNVIQVWDLSGSKDNSVMAFMVDDGLNQNTYHLYIQSNEDYIYANPNSSYLFEGFHKLKQINNFNLFNTNQTTNMRAMFSGCSSLTSIDLSNFDTSQVTDMSSMFGHIPSPAGITICGFTSLNLSNFNTSKVTDMNSMFAGCLDLSDLDISSFNTELVTNMFAMFRECNSLTSLNLSHFNTGNVTDMNGMFAGCNSLTSLNLANFNTNKVTDMARMFSRCSSLTTLDLSSFTTPNLKTVGWSYNQYYGMFYSCSGLTTIDMRNFTFTNITDYSTMLSNITSGITIYVKDTNSQSFINSRLNDAGKNGTVTIMP